MISTINRPEAVIQTTITIVSLGHVHRRRGFLTAHHNRKEESITKSEVERMRK